MNAWRWEQNTGRMFRPDGIMLAVGYSGHYDGGATGGPNDHRNRSLDQVLHALGPIPVGTYSIGTAFNDAGGKGPVAMHLNPDPANDMLGRSAFMIHGDSASHPGQASEGCIILPRNAREAIAADPCRVLIVEVS